MLRIQSLNLKKKDLAIILGSFSAFLAFFFMIYLPYVATVLEPPAPASISFSSSKGVISSNVTVNDAVPNQRPLIDDEMTYQISYKNLSKKNITLLSYLEVLHDGIVKDRINSTGPISILPLDQNSQSFVFYPKNTGLNQVRINAAILNGTSSMQIDSIHQAIDIKIYSQQDVLSLNLNTITANGIIVSLGLGGPTLIFLILSFQLSKAESDTRLRPWIGPDTSNSNDGTALRKVGNYNDIGVSISDENVTSATLNQLQTVTEIWKLSVTNYGELPAKNMSWRIRPFRGPSVPNIEDIMRENPTVSAPVMPKQKVDLTIAIPFLWIRQANVETRVFVSVRINYDFGRRKGRYDLIVEYKDTALTIVYSKIS